MPMDILKQKEAFIDLFAFLDLIQMREDIHHLHLAMSYRRSAMISILILKMKMLKLMFIDLEGQEVNQLTQLTLLCA